MIVGLYNSKDELQQSIGQPLHYLDGSLLGHGCETYGIVAVAGPPSGDTPRWVAEVTLIGGRIVRVD